MHYHLSPDPVVYTECRRYPAHPATDIPSSAPTRGKLPLGDAPNTVKWLEKSADRREYAALDVAVHPIYARVRNAAGFQALMKRMGLTR